MEIKQFNKTWASALTNRLSTNYIILHHVASSSASPESVHSTHLSNGWAGIGYNFYVRKDGSIYEGRPINKVGAHTEGYNSNSVGICFEGNFNEEIMGASQINAGIELIEYCKKLYPSAKIFKHKDFAATACPGDNFPFEEITTGKISIEELTDINDIVWEYSHRDIITDSDLWIEKLKNDVNSYWLARKTLHYIRKNNL